MTPGMRFDRRSWVVLIAAVLTVGLTLRLGLWQLDRAAQKRALEVMIFLHGQLPPVPQERLSFDAATAADQHHQRIRLHGQWLPEATVFLDNRQMAGRPGFFVMTPLRLVNDGTAPAVPRLLWVQRGWVARDNNDRTRLPPVPTPAGAIEVTGRVAPAPARLYQFSAEEKGPIRQNLDLAASAGELGQPVYPVTVVQTEAAAGPPDGLMRDWPQQQADVQKHHGYAFQWFALSTLVAGLYVWFQLVQPRRRHVVKP